jgi:hypothetical protein
VAVREEEDRFDVVGEHRPLPGQGSQVRAQQALVCRRGQVEQVRDEWLVADHVDDGVADHRSVPIRAR